MANETTTETTDRKGPGLDFIRSMVAEDLKTGKWKGRVATRFPPEPNGYLHIGHAKSLCLNFGIAQEFNGVCHIRFDDTNPLTEKQEYVNSIKEDVRWMGFDWGEHEYYASDYFDQLYEWAIQLIKDGKAYVDDLTQVEVSEHRGTVTQVGKESPHRNRSVDENLDLFTRMRDGEFEEGTCVLRAKIDMSHPNMLLRDPVMYRIIKASHYRTGDKWCIYPTYDYTHGQSDSIERITYSICTLEFEVHRPLYNWYIQALGIFPSEQTEFARLNLTYTVMSKRKFIALVEEGHVKGWDDPRMPTISGIRRRGYTPEAIRDFCGRIGVARAASINEIGQLEHCLREDLNKRAARVMAVLDPLRVVIENYPDGQVEEMEAVNNPEDPSAGTRNVPFSKTIYIEREDFMEDPPKKFFRLAPGGEVRLRYAYWIKCTDVVKDSAGNVIELRCSYDPETKGGNNPSDGRKVKATLHWVSADHAVDAEVRLYDRLFTKENPNALEEGEDWRDYLNPESLQVIPAAKVEPSLATAKPGDKFQFERKGYFCVDPDSTDGKLVFNRSVTLRDTWANVQKRGE